MSSVKAISKILSDDFSLRSGSCSGPVADVTESVGVDAV